MKVNEIVEYANSAPGEFSVSDVLDFFKRSNVGHWSTESGMVRMNADDGDIVFTIGAKTIDCNIKGLTPAGQILLLNGFFDTFKPKALTDLELVTNNVIGRFALVDRFRMKINERLSGKAQYIRDGNSRFAFMERIRTNDDKSMLYTYDIIDLDNSANSRFAIMLPGLNPQIYIFAERHEEIVMFRAPNDGYSMEFAKPWERAAHCATVSKSLFENYTKVTSANLEAAFALTEIDYEPAGKANDHNAKDSLKTAENEKV